MSTMDLSCSATPSTLTSSAPLPIPMCISSPEQTTNHFPGHLSLGEHDSLWVGEVTKEVVRIAWCMTVMSGRHWDRR